MKVTDTGQSRSEDEYQYFEVAGIKYTAHRSRSWHGTLRDGEWGSWFLSRYYPKSRRTIYQRNGDQIGWPDIDAVVAWLEARHASEGTPQ